MSTGKKLNAIRYFIQSVETTLTEGSITEHKTPAGHHRAAERIKMAFSPLEV